MDTIKIKASRKKTIIAILGCLMFVVLGGWMVIDPEPTNFFKNPHFIQTVGVIGILFAVVCLVVYIKAVFSDGFNLTITKEGILDHTNYYKMGMVRWEDVESIKSASLFSEKYLCVYVKDPEKYINSKRGIKKFLLKRNFEMVGTPITISARALKKCNHSELKKIVMQSYDKYKQGKEK